MNKGSINDNLKYYKRLCVGKDTYSRNQSEAAQRVQEDFYSKWVVEMIRIAKVHHALAEVLKVPPYISSHLLTSIV